MRLESAAIQKVDDPSDGRNAMILINMMIQKSQHSVEFQSIEAMNVKMVLTQST
jgi:hypothetical protein